ncbi:MAG: hypothetical protein AABY40_01110 [Nanoarchaeota archaeon]
MADERYFASVQYREGMELTNNELNVLRNLSSMYKGSIYEEASNAQARLLAFEFPSKEQAEGFKKSSETLEKILQVRIGKL